MTNVEYYSCEKRSRSNQRQSKLRLDTHATVNRIENSVECRRILAGISSSPELGVCESESMRKKERKRERERKRKKERERVMATINFFRIM